MNARRHDFWAYAGSFGALWGALEATLGTFLHALKLPFAGVLLASMGAALLVALRVLVPRPGLLLATGAVCAAVKLSSPGTVLVGPAVGILTESLLVEIVTLPFGANGGSALLGGALAAAWAICQKVVTQIFLYGAPIVALYRELLQRGTKMLGVSVASGVQLVGLFVGAMAAFGALAALAGLRAGQRATHLEPPLRVEPQPTATTARAPRWRALAVAVAAGAELTLLVLLPRAFHALVLVGLLALVCAVGPWLATRIGSLRSWVVAFGVLAVLGAVLGPKDTWQVRLSVQGAALAVTMVARAVGLVLACQATVAALPPLQASSSPFARAVTAALAALPRFSHTMGAALRARQARGETSPLRLALGLLDDAVALAAGAARDS